MLTERQRWDQSRNITTLATFPLTLAIWMHIPLSLINVAQVAVVGSAESLRHIDPDFLNEGEGVDVHLVVLNIFMSENQSICTYYC